MQKHIPNIITLFNLFFGCCALVFIFQRQYIPAFVVIFLGGVADYSDGLIARWLKVDSPMGKELDSLADMITFGVVPGAALYVLLVEGLSTEITEQTGLTMAALPAFLISIFAALRLAKFNLDTRQTEQFLGLPTPSCTIFVTGLMLVHALDSYGLRHLVSQPVFLYPTILVLCYLLISDIPMFSMKFKGSGWKGNEKRITFLVLGILLLLVFKELGFSLIILLYVFFSLVQSWFTPRGKVL